MSSLNESQIHLGLILRLKFVDVVRLMQAIEQQDLAHVCYQRVAIPGTLRIFDMTKDRATSKSEATPAA